MDRLVATCRTATLDYDSVDALSLAITGLRQHLTATGGLSQRRNEMAITDLGVLRGWGGHDLVDRDGVKAGSIVDPYIDARDECRSHG